MARKNLLKGFKKPSGLSLEQNEITQDYGKFVAFPFERGFGTTIGNTMRRVLLSSIQGFAVVAVRITSYDADGNAHVISSEFEPIPGVVEDTPEIISNLKGNYWVYDMAGKVLISGEFASYDEVKAATEVTLPAIQSAYFIYLLPTDRRVIKDRSYVIMVR